MADVALISVVTSGVIGAGGLVFGAWNGYAERASRREESKAERAAAREDRIGERRAEVYVDLLANLERDLFVYEAIAPHTLRPSGPTPLSDDDWIKWKARIAAFGSAQVIDLFRTHSDVGSRVANAWMACEMLANSGLRPGSEFGEQFAIIDQARKEMRHQTLPALEKRIREELTI